MHDICQHCDDAPASLPARPRQFTSGRWYRYHRPDEVYRAAAVCECLSLRVIYFNSDLNIAQKCTFCAHLLDDGWKRRGVLIPSYWRLKFGDEKTSKSDSEG